MGDLADQMAEAVMDVMFRAEHDLDDQKIYDIVCNMERQAASAVLEMCQLFGQPGLFGLRGRLLGHNEPLKHIKQSGRVSEFYEEGGKMYISLPQMLRNKIQSAILCADRLACIKHESNGYKDTQSLWSPLIQEWRTQLCNIDVYFETRPMRGPFEATRMLRQLRYHLTHQPCLSEFLAFFGDSNEEKIRWRFLDEMDVGIGNQQDTDPANAILCLVTCGSKLRQDDDEREYAFPISFHIHTNRTRVIMEYINCLCAYYCRKVREQHGIDSDI
jgi:hypothetical protein